VNWVESRRGYPGVQKEGGGSSKNKCGLGKTQEQKGKKVLQNYIGVGGLSLKMSTGCATHCVEALGLLLGKKGWVGYRIVITA
jgi:hypothetical protein